MLDYGSVQELQYLGMVINETLRKYPPTAVAPRTCTREYTFPGMYRVTHLVDEKLPLTEI